MSAQELRCDNDEIWSTSIIRAMSPLCLRMQQMMNYQVSARRPSRDAQHTREIQERNLTRLAMKAGESDCIDIG